MNAVRHGAVILGRSLGWVLLIGAAPLSAANLAFVTSTEGDGILGTWPEAGGNTGLAAGDAICLARATAANLPNPESFVAWLSTTDDDAYCRVHGLTGKRTDNCGQPTLPTFAGPWQRTDGTPFMGKLDQTGAVYTPLNRDEFNGAANALVVWTGTGLYGTANTRNCGNWVADTDVDIGHTYATSPGWTEYPGYTFCSGHSGHLMCLQKGAGAALQVPVPSGHKQAFLTSLRFTGNLGAAVQASGNTGLAAGDAICRNLAQSANLRDSQSFKVYLADETNPATRFQNGGPWDRVDGIRFADSFVQIASGYVTAPLNVTETGAFKGFPNFYAWTGMQNGVPGFAHCSHWTMSLGFGWSAWLDGIGPNWPPTYPEPSDCSGGNSLLCLSDADLIFQNGLQ
ncbi:MAG: hypothetical protein ABI411_19980 [Tahibacter sp.]